MSNIIEKGNNNILNIDIDKYIEWYKGICNESIIGRIIQREILIINNLRSQTNYHCKTYKSKEKAKRYLNQITKKYSEKIKENNNLNHSIYYPTEWLVPTNKDWLMFERCKNKNEYLVKLDKYLYLCKDTLKAKKKVINDFINELNNRELSHLKSYKDFEIIELNFFEKGRYEAIENDSYMGYCQEQAMMGLIYDYAQIKAIEHAKKQLKDLKSNSLKKESTNYVRQTTVRKPLTWVGQKTAIGTLFGLLHKNGIIQGSKADINRGLMDMFNNLSKDTLTDNIALKVNDNEVKNNYNATTERLLKEWIDHLKKKHPKTKK